MFKKAEEFQFIFSLFVVSLMMLQVALYDRMFNE
jgi:hypothetical protein